MGLVENAMPMKLDNYVRCEAMLSKALVQRHTFEVIGLAVKMPSLSVKIFCCSGVICWFRKNNTPLSDAELN